MDDLDAVGGAYPLRDEAIDELLRWLGDAVHADYHEDIPFPPDSAFSLLEFLQGLWAARGHAPWGPRGVGPWLRDYDPAKAPQSFGHFCLVCNQREATEVAQSRLTGQWLKVCGLCKAESPRLGSPEVSAPLGEDASRGITLPPLFPQTACIPKDAVLAPLALGDVLPLEEQGTWRVVGEDAHSYECELVR